jgi:hypothetical protein
MVHEWDESFGEGKLLLLPSGDFGTRENLPGFARQKRPTAPASVCTRVTWKHAPSRAWHAFGVDDTKF